MKFLLGRKQAMTQIFRPDGQAATGTVIVAGPVVVTQLKTADRDGYPAIQVGFGETKLTRLAKPQRGHLAKAGLAAKAFQSLREFSLPADAAAGFQPGQAIDVSIFSIGDQVAVSGVTKGKGFQGVVSRHGFHGGSRTHGQKHSEREPGSIGVGGVQRVLKGTRMAGRTGGERRTVKNLEVLAVDPAKNLLVVKGAVPGHRGTLLEIRG